MTRLIGSILFLLAAAALIPAPFVYHFTSGGIWRYSIVGRALLQFMGVLSAVMTLALASLLFGPLPSYVRLAVWAGVAFVSWRLVWTMIHVRNRKAAAPEA